MTEWERAIPQVAVEQDRHDRRAAVARKAPAPDPTVHSQLERVRSDPRDRAQPAEALVQLPEVWHSIHGEGPGFLALFSGTRARNQLSQPRSVYFPWPTHAEAAVRWVADQAEQGREIYHCAHLVTRPRRRKEDAAALSSLYVDLDHDQVAPGGLPPTVVVESSPGRLQCYWRLTEPVPPLVGEALNRRLAYALGADRSGWDLTQLLRVPGTANRKYPDAPSVRLLWRSEQRSDAARLLAMLPEVPPAPSAPVPTGSPAVHEGQVPADQPPVRLSQAAQHVWRGETARRTGSGAVDRSAALVQIARVLYDAGATRPVIVAALVERDTALGWEKYTHRRDAEAQYQRVVDVVERGTPTRRRH